MLRPSIEEIVRAGLAFNPRLLMGLEDIRSSVVVLFDDLERLGVDYVLVGGVALLSYVEGRNTPGSGAGRLASEGSPEPRRGFLGTQAKPWLTRRGPR